ncbi:hypothetical protein FPOA_13103 [Fusarium poae]|uniref:FAD linked oxidase N-terminal domain-containing protein n=1 Tax=Fusarium poae TaxID=36050 RepID=A0A1B8A6T0_FUSPO|nr:hypothetical protein FPOA_13103 [Fusarium poae]
MPTSVRVLPPGIRTSEHGQFFDELAKIVGDENTSRNASTGALTGPHQSNSYGDPYTTVNQDQHLPSGAVRLASVEEVQQVLRLANQFGIPLWTVSRGSVVLDLHRMNRVLEVNEVDAYAIVEPGVSFLTFMKRLNGETFRYGHLVQRSDGDLSWATRWTAASAILLVAW